MRTTCAPGLRSVALLLQLAAIFGAALLPSAAAQAAAPQALETAVSAPIDVSPDGELLLLFLSGGQGLDLANTRTGQRDLVSPTPNTGYFASISPDKKYVCFKDFQPAKGRLLQVPVLYDIAQKKQLPLADPAPAAGNPVASSRGQIAYTLGQRLIVLNPDLSRFLETDLGAVVNVLAFSPDGRQLAFSDPQEAVSWIDLDTGSRGTAPPGSLHGYQPRFSPDGQALLARNSKGEFTGWNRASGLSRDFGPAEAATWLDNDTVALVRKTAVGSAVHRTDVVKRRLSDGATSLLVSRNGDAAIALSPSVVALADGGGVNLADTRTGLPQTVALQPRSLAAAPKADSMAAPSAAPAPNVTTNGSVVQLLGVPYVNQVYDTPDSFGGWDSCCNTTASLMSILYYNRLPPHPITCSARGSSHTSNYGYYIPNIYSYNGIVFNVPSSSAWGSSLAGYYGGFGYYLQDDVSEDGDTRSIRLADWIALHGLTSGTYNLPQSGADLQNINLARAEINANHPVVMLNSITSAGHYITCIGYVQNQFTLIFNDPYGNKNISYPNDLGAGAYYDWPGYNNGYMNLTSVWCYIYARGTVAANTNWGSYWDLNGATAGAGTAPGGVWDSTSTNWSSSANGTVATGPWAGQNAYFSAGTDSTGSYTISVSGTQVVANLFVQRGTVTFTGGQLYFLGTGSYFSNYVASGATAIFNTPFGGTGSPDKWGPGTAVYSGASTSTGYYTHNEGTLAFGNNAALGTAQLNVGDVTGAKVVTLQSADSNARTLPNYLSLLAVNLNIGAGGNLTFSGPINMNVTANPARAIAVSNSITTFSGVLTNTGGLIKTGPGTLVLSGTSANTYGNTSANGNTTVSGGTLQLSKTAGVAAVPNGSLIINTGGTLLLGAANQISDGVLMTLAGGTFQTAGFTEQLGTLGLTASSQIDLGAGATVLKFAASSGVAWTAAKTLTITNWNGSINGGGAEQVLFGSASSGLSAAQVSQIRFANPLGFPAGSYGATILSTGEVVPLPGAPAITTQPANAVTGLNLNLSFSVTATGDTPLSYQWRRNGASLSGATASILTIIHAQATNAGTYTVVVTNAYGTATSSNALLAVLDPYILNQPQSQSVTAGAPATFTVGVVGTAPLSCSWSKGSVALSDGGNISGSGTATLALASVQAGDVGTYSVTVSNVNGSVVSSNVTLYAACAPAIVTQPASQKVLAGAIVTLSVSLVGPGPMTNQWWKDGTNLVDGGKFSGTTSTSLVLSNVQIGECGNYSLVASNTNGSTTSSNALMCLWPLAAWGRNDYTQTTIPGGLSNVVAVAGGLYHSLAARADGTVNAWGAGMTNSGTSPQLGQAIVPSGLSNVLGVAAGYYHSLALRSDGTVVAWGAGTTNTGVNPHYGQAMVPPNITNAVDVAGGGYHTVALKADGTVAAWGAGAVDTGSSPDYGQSMVPAGLSNVVGVSAGGYHTLAQKADGSLVAWGAGALNAGVSPDYGQSMVPAGLSNVVMTAAGGYHSLALKADGTVVAWGDNTYGQSAVPAGLTNVAGIAAGRYFSLALKCDGTLVAWGSNSYNQTNTPGTVANVVSIAGGGFQVLAIESDGSPALITQPVSQTVAAGANVIYAAMAVGSQPLSYQWQLNGTNIPGATAAVLSLANVQLDDVGAYAVTVSNAVGAVTSSNAELTVLVPPGITTQPVCQTVSAGSPVTFIVGAVGCLPLGYQWRFGSAAIAGATQSSFSLLSAQSGDAGSYSVILTNAAGSITSDVATLVVLLATMPGILTAPVYGANGVYEFNVAGAAGINYVIASSTNLTDWTPLETNTSPFTFTDTNAVQAPLRFYRAHPLP